MWDYASLYAKAQLYFSRAASHPQADDDEFGIWSLLGLEFLLRAPLARVHPTLLAAPEGDSILSAVGINIGKEPKSVLSHSVISRLQHVVPGFDSDRAADATVLMNLRNAELHTGASAVANAPTEFWLPRLLRVVEVLCQHLEVDIEQLLGEEVVKQARGLVAEEDKRVVQDVKTRINRAKAFFEGLQPEEVSARRAQILTLKSTAVDCPACGSKIPQETENVRNTNERLEDDNIVWDAIYIAKSLSCPVCGLKLESTAEMAAAGLPQQFTTSVGESLYDHYLDSNMAYDYGND